MIGWEILSGKFFIKLVEWFDFTLIYSGILPGLYLPVVQSHVKSWKFTILRLHFNPKCRLTNPAKSEIGKLSKFLIENVNTKVREMLTVIQWRNIKSKNKCIFIQCDVEEFCLSISEDLLKKL